MEYIKALIKQHEISLQVLKDNDCPQITQDVIELEIEKLQMVLVRG